MRGAVLVHKLGLRETSRSTPGDLRKNEAIPGAARAETAPAAMAFLRDIVIGASPYSQVRPTLYMVLRALLDRLRCPGDKPLY